MLHFHELDFILGGVPEAPNERATSACPTEAHLHSSTDLQEIEDEVSLSNRGRQ